MTISERIFYILSEKGISQKNFSEKTGISQSTISDWKRKGTNPAADKIMIICDALGISVYELLNETDSTSKQKQVEYVVIPKNSEEYMLLESFQEFDKNARQRLLGYMEALRAK